MQRIILVTFAILMLGIVFVGCESDATVAERNTSKEAEMFRVYRRVVFYNGITDAYILTIEGYSSITVRSDGVLTVTVKTPEGEFLKHYLGLSDNVTYFVEQLQSSDVSDDRYKVIFKPSVIIPDIELSK